MLQGNLSKMQNSLSISAPGASASAKLVLVLVLVTIFSVIASGTSGHAAHDEDKSTKIVGGRPARKDEVPYIVSIHGDYQQGRGDQHVCGGSIYNKKFIITAAHCFDNSNLTDVRIVAGTLDTKDFDKSAQVIGIKKRTLHPGYNTTTNMYDIAVLELEKELTFTSSVQPIPIAPPGIVSSGPAKVSGWGVHIIQAVFIFTGPRGNLSDHLLTVDISIIPREECGKYFVYWKIPPPPETALCAGHLPAGGKDSCQGDSGGPLECSRKVAGQDKPEKYICGVVSSGYGCGLLIPGAYMEVARVHDWILETAGA